MLGGHRRVTPDLFHRFEPRLKGNPEACNICGGTYWDPVHRSPKDKPAASARL